MKIFLIGSGGHSRVILDCAKTLKHDVVGIIDINTNKDKREKINNIKVYPKGYIKKIKNKSSIFLAIGDNNIRKKYFDNFKKKFKIINLIHPSSIISNRIKIGKGNYIGPGVIINSNVKIYNNCIINSGSLIEHECTIQDNSHVGPSVKVAGRCVIGKNVFIGIGSTIIDKIKIGKNTIVGAGSLVVNNLVQNKTYFGIPAKEKK